MSMAQMSVKLMSKGAHRKADTVGMIIAQLSMTAAIRNWGQETEYAITKEMKQLHWCDSESILQGVSNDRGDSLLSSEMRYEYAHLEAA